MIFSKSKALINEPITALRLVLRPLLALLSLDMKALIIEALAPEALQKLTHKQVDNIMLDDSIGTKKITDKISKKGTQSTNFLDRRWAM